MAALKMVSGGDAMRARHIYSRPFDVRYSGAVLVGSNEYPKTYDVSGALRRFVFIPFAVRPKDPDPALPELLTADTGAVIDWLVAGYKEYRERGLEVPKASTDVSQRFHRTSDTVAHFVSSWMTPAEGCETPVEGVYSSYRRFCELLGYTPRRFSLDWVLALEMNGVTVENDSTVVGWKCRTI